MSELERLEEQRKEINKKIQQLKRQRQTVNGSVFLRDSGHGVLNVCVKARYLDNPEYDKQNRVILRSNRPEAIIEAIGEIIEDLKIIQRSLAEEEGKG